MILHITVHLPSEWITKISVKYLTVLGRKSARCHHVSFDSHFPEKPGSTSSIRSRREPFGTKWHGFFTSMLHYMPFKSTASEHWRKVKNRPKPDNINNQLSPCFIKYQTPDERNAVPLWQLFNTTPQHVNSKSVCMSTVLCIVTVKILQKQKKTMMHSTIVMLRQYALPALPEHRLNEKQLLQDKVQVFP